MENRKDIGKAISEKLSTLDKTPGNQVWSGISYELEKKKKRRIGFFFFWAKIIALIIVGCLAGLFVFDHYTGANWFPTNKSKGTITVDSVNGESVTLSPNNTPNQKTGNTSPQSHTNKANKDKDNVIDKTETNLTNTKAEKNKTNPNANHSDSGTNLTISKEGNTSVKSLKKGKLNTFSSKPGKGKSGLFSKEGKKSNAEFSKKGKNNSKKEKTDKLLSENETATSNPSTVDLRALQNKSTGKSNSDKEKSTPTIDLSSLENKKISKKDSIIAQRQKEKELKIKERDSLIAQKQKDKELKVQTKDSLIAQKQKDKEITIYMYPKDSVKVDSIIYRKIQVDVFISPTLYGYFSKGSTLDRGLDSLSRKSQIRFSYGFGITYDLTERLSVRIGYRKINLSYVTKNAPIDADNYRGVDYDATASNQAILTAFNAIPAESPVPAIMDITQKISYTEIPLEVKYKFMAKKVGLKASLGVSYLFLDENKVSISTLNGLSQDIGTTKNLSNTSVSASIGFEADYPIFKNTKIFLEPLLNYQIKAFSDGNYKPYIFGVHTGIRYSFN